MAPIIDTDDKALRVLDAAGIPYRLVKAIQSQSQSQSQSASSQSSKPQKSQESEYILLDQEHQNGSYSQVDLLIPFERTHLNQSWEECKTPILLASEQGYMPTIRQHVDLLTLIKSGEAFDEYGNKIDSKRLETLFDEITKVRDPWRAEHLDAKFGSGTITYHSIQEDGTVKEITENLDDCLMRDRSPGISLDSWLKTANSHGMPTENTEDGSLYYWFPRDGRVARFDAGSDGACFSCGGGASNRDGSLGVRVVRKK